MYVYTGVHACLWVDTLLYMNIFIHTPYILSEFMTPLRENASCLYFSWFNLLSSPSEASLFSIPVHQRKVFCQSYSIADSAFSLHAANMSSIPHTSNGLLSFPEVIPVCRVKSKNWQSPIVTQYKKKKEKSAHMVFTCENKEIVLLETCGTWDHQGHI